jgi:hypothetical protein
MALKMRDAIEVSGEWINKRRRKTPEPKRRDLTAKASAALT